MSYSTPLELTSVFHIVKTDNITKEVLFEEKVENLVTKVGREDILNFVFAAASASSFIYLGAGASSTAATVNDTRLTYELIGNANRKTCSVGAVSTGTYTISGNTYYKTVALSSSYDGDTDGNAGQTFREYGLFNINTLPGTPTSSSGRMFNHLVAGSDTTLSPGTTITITINVYT